MGFYGDDCSKINKIYASKVEAVKPKNGKFLPNGGDVTGKDPDTFACSENS